MSDRTLPSSSPVAGMDVHKSSVRLAVVDCERLLFEKTLPYDVHVVERELRAAGVARACYEAGPTGFALCRHLNAAGIACEVVAPGLVPVRSSDRVKTDARDARKLARWYAGGLLQPIWVPSPEVEAVRDLVRARDDARRDRMRARHRLGSFLLRHERRMPTTSWTVTRRAWLGRQAFDQAPSQVAFDDYLTALDLTDRRIEALEREVDDWSKHPTFAQLVAKLRCMRGIDTLTALGIVAEIGSFDRFTTATEFMSYVGLVPSERSSGDKQARGPITRTGNRHVRRLLIEAAHNQRRRPARSAHVTRRQQGQDARTVARAQHAQTRLHKRWQRMTARGKQHNKIAAAVARELAGHVWAIATDQPMRPTA